MLELALDFLLYSTKSYLKNWLIKSLILIINL